MASIATKQQLHGMGFFLKPHTQMSSFVLKRVDFVQSLNFYLVGCTFSLLLVLDFGYPP